MVGDPPGLQSDTILVTHELDWPSISLKASGGREHILDIVQKNVLFLIDSVRLDLDLLHLPAKLESLVLEHHVSWFVCQL